MVGFRFNATGLRRNFLSYERFRNGGRRVEFIKILHFPYPVLTSHEPLDYFETHEPLSERNSKL
jgi:hypothetical protein